MAAGGWTQVGHTVCRGCPAYARACCSGVLSRIDEVFDTKTLMEWAMTQHMSWRAEGGVTLGGGEPLAQPDSAVELLRRFREEGVGTALGVCGYVPFKAFQKATPFCRLIFSDLKYMAPEVHRQHTGVGNRRILDDLMALSREFPNLSLRVRTPLIPGIDDDRGQLSEIVQLLRRLPSLIDYGLFPYHNWEKGKYRQLGQGYPLVGLGSLDRRAIEHLDDELRAELGLRPG